MQLYFAGKSKEKVEEELEKMQDDLDEKKTEKNGVESVWQEKQRTAKDAHREKQKLEMRVQKEVLWINFM